MYEAEYTEKEIAPAERCCAYVRKSRYDRDYADCGLEETLKRHEALLCTAAKSYGVTIEKFYREVASGEGISQRPEMRKLLNDVSARLWDAVFVIDIDRLSRGNGVDQGTVAQVFKYSDTKIVTPQKLYDPDNELDEEYFEFSLFMSRKEYKIINKRLERGRKQSAKEGKYLGSVPPYGYERKKLIGEKGYTLTPNEDEAKYVKLMFRKYLYEGFGTQSIAVLLNESGVPTRTGVPWSSSVVKTILNNCVYAGYIRCSRRKKTTVLLDGKIVTKHTNLKEYPIYKGLHEPIISFEEWQAVSRTAAANNRAGVPLNVAAPLRNPYAGVLICGKCGKKLSRVSGDRREPRLLCRTKGCDCASVPFAVADKAIFSGIKKWLSAAKRDARFTDGVADEENYEIIIEAIKKEKKALDSRLEKCYNLLEREVYTIEEFELRRGAITKKQSELDEKMRIASDELSSRRSLFLREKYVIPGVSQLLDGWEALSPADRNRFIRLAFSRISFFRPKGSQEFFVSLSPLF